MALFLLDAAGVVSGRAADPEGLPLQLAQLPIGAALADHLQPQALAGDVDAEALQRGLLGLLAGERTSFEHRHGRWCLALQTCAPGSCAAAVLVVEQVHPTPDLARSERQRERLEDLLVSRTVQLAEAGARADAASRRRSEGLAQASHEVRTPLNAILSLAHLLEQGLDDPGQLRRVQTIAQSARQVGAVFDEVLVQALGESAAGPPPAGAGAADAGEQLHQRHAGRRVLLAEDDEVNQQAMVELLAAVGLVVDTAGDGREAVDRACGRDYALILLDLRMPRLDGMAAARMLRRLPGLQDTPILAISANAFEADREACRAAGMNDFLPKPVDVPRLYALLLRWLDERPAAGQADPAGASPAAAAGRRAETSAADAASMAPLLGLEGIDASRGLASVAGKVMIYRRLLQVFADTHAGDGQRLQQQMQQGDAAAAGALAHRLRGSAATLGLVDVETAAAALESAIDDRSDPAALPQLVQAVDETLAETLARLQAALVD